MAYFDQYLRTRWLRNLNSDVSAWVQSSAENPHVADFIAFVLDVPNTNRIVAWEGLGSFCLNNFFRKWVRSMNSLYKVVANFFGRGFVAFAKASVDLVWVEAKTEYREMALSLVAQAG